MKAKPLTVAELRAMKRNFDKTFDEVYAQIKASGALSDEYFEPHNHMIARMALVIAAEKYAPNSSYKKDFANLRHFV